jgi:hypothetical protein
MDREDSWLASSLWTVNPRQFGFQAVIRNILQRPRMLDARFVPLEIGPPPPGLILADGTSLEAEYFGLPLKPASSPFARAVVQKSKAALAGLEVLWRKNLEKYANTPRPMRGLRQYQST